MIQITLKRYTVAWYRLKLREEECRSAQLQERNDILENERGQANDQTIREVRRVTAEYLSNPGSDADAVVRAIHEAVNRSRFMPPAYYLARGEQPPQFFKVPNGR
jgi:hypothetical protein